MQDVFATGKYTLAFLSGDGIHTTLVLLFGFSLAYFLSPAGNDYSNLLLCNLAFFVHKLSVSLRVIKSRAC